METRIERLPEILTTEDIARRYKCSKNTAQRYMREIRDYNNGGALKRGRVTSEEIRAYENRNLNQTTKGEE